MHVHERFLDQRLCMRLGVQFWIKHGSWSISSVVLSNQVYCQAGGEAYDLAICGGNLVCSPAVKSICLLIIVLRWAMVLACCLLNTMNTYHVGQDCDYVSTAFVCMYVCMIHCDTPVYSSYCLGQPSLFYGHYFLIVCPRCTNPIQNDLLNAATCL